jgi:hypothetical protein
MKFFIASTAFLLVILGCAQAHVRGGVKSNDGAIGKISERRRALMSKKGMSKKGMNKCRGTFYVAQKFDGDIIEANGTSVTPSEATGETGERWFYVNDVYDEPQGTAVGFDTEQCTRPNTAENWYCAGTYANLYGCEGNLNFAGPFSDVTLSGTYAITGGTGDFLGAKGCVHEEFSYVTDYAIRRIDIE